MADKKYQYRRRAGREGGDDSNAEDFNSDDETVDGSESSDDESAGELYRCSRYDCRNLEPFSLSTGGACPRCGKDDRIVSENEPGSTGHAYGRSRAASNHQSGALWKIVVPMVLILALATWYFFKAPSSPEPPIDSAPRLAGVPPSLTFEFSDTAEPKSTDLDIRNDGGSLLIVSEVSTSPTDFYSASPGNFELEPGESAVLTVRAALGANASLPPEGVLSIVSNHQISGEILVSLISLKPDQTGDPTTFFDDYDRTSTILKKD